MNKIPVYFMPGMAASPSIFENIKLDKDTYEMLYLEWKLPFKQETLQEYVARVCRDIKHDNPILIGVSFGGIIVQEMSRIIQTRKVVIISSVKCNKEFPSPMKIAKLTKVYKLFPTALFQNIEKVVPYVFNEEVSKSKAKLYEKYLSVRDTVYLEWSLEQIILWDREIPDPEVIHIHGSKDEIFPIKYISDCLVLEGGTHAMIINKFRWLNKKLPDLL